MFSNDFPSSRISGYARSENRFQSLYCGLQACEQTSAFQARLLNTLKHSPDEFGKRPIIEWSFFIVLTLGSG